MKLRNALLGAAALALAFPAAVSAKPEHGRDHAAHAKPGKSSKARHASTRYNSHASTRYNGYACPPGLAKKNPRCVPPGHWKKGNRLTSGWTRYYTPYDRLPEYYRSRYDMDPDYRYLYRNDRVYVIDAVTRAIVDIFVR